MAPAFNLAHGQDIPYITLFSGNDQRNCTSKEWTQAQEALSYRWRDQIFLRKNPILAALLENFLKLLWEYTPYPEKPELNPNKKPQPVKREIINNQNILLL
jgi:hypothetical protein